MILLHIAFFKFEDPLPVPVLVLSEVGAAVVVLDCVLVGVVGGLLLVGGGGVGRGAGGGGGGGGHEGKGGDEELQEEWFVLHFTQCINCLIASWLYLHDWFCWLFCGLMEAEVVDRGVGLFMGLLLPSCVIVVQFLAGFSCKFEFSRVKDHQPSLRKI